VVLLVVSITTGTPFYMFFFVSIIIESILRTNFDKYHPGYFGKVGMRRFHLTRNQNWRPTINVDKLWSLVPEEQKKGLTEHSEIVPVIDTLNFGYGKVLGNGLSVLYFSWLLCLGFLHLFSRLPKLPCIVKARFVSAKAEYVYLYFYLECAVVIIGDAIGPKSRKPGVLCH
jgi:hypothetical protein